MDVRRPSRIPTWVDRGELDDPGVIGGLGAATERGALTLVLAVAPVVVGGVVARRIGVPDLDRCPWDRGTGAVDDAETEAERMPGVALGDVSTIELLVQWERAGRRVVEDRADGQGFEVGRREVGDAGLGRLFGWVLGGWFAGLGLGGGSPIRFRWIGMIPGWASISIGG